MPTTRAAYDVLVARQPDATRRVGYVFPARAGGQRRRIRHAYDLALERAAISGATFHTLRHTTASHLMQRGVNLREVQEILGHSSITMTTKYAHLSSSHLRSAIERLDGLTPTETTHKLHMDVESAPSVV